MFCIWYSVYGSVEYKAVSKQTNCEVNTLINVIYIDEEPKEA